MSSLHLQRQWVTCPGARTQVPTGTSTLVLQKAFCDAVRAAGECSFVRTELWASSAVAFTDAGVPIRTFGVWESASFCGKNCYSSLSSEICSHFVPPLTGWCWPGRPNAQKGCLYARVLFCPSEERSIRGWEKRGGRAKGFFPFVFVFGFAPATLCLCCLLIPVTRSNRSLTAWH